MSGEYVILALVAASLSGTATSMQKKALAKLPQLTFNQFIREIFKVLKQLLSNRIWVLGLLTGMAAWLIYVQAIAIGDLLVVRPLINANTLVVILIGVTKLKEQIHRTEWSGIVAMIIGIFCLSYNPQTTGTYFYDLSILLLVIGLLLTTAIGIQLLGRISNKKALISALTAGLLYSLAEIFTKWMTIESGSESPSFLNPLLLVISPIFWGLATLTAISFMLKQVTLSQGRSAVAIPLITSLSISIPMVAAVFIFGEMILLPVNGQIIFPISYLRVIGTATILAGTIILNIYYRGMASATIELVDNGDAARIDKANEHVM
ncbi:MAG: EamA family transporter [Promethearchaeota archaeon]